MTCGLAPSGSRVMTFPSSRTTRRSGWVAGPVEHAANSAASAKAMIASRILTVRTNRTWQIRVPVLRPGSRSSYDVRREYTKSEGDSVHLNRLMALVGVLIGIIGLFMKSLVTDAEGPAVETVDGVAKSIPTIWGGLDTWAQIVLVILIIVVIFLSLRPDMAKALNRNDSMIVSGIGVVLLVYAIIKWMDAGDKADGLVARLADGGLPTELFSINRGMGFIVLIIGTVLVTFAGAMGFVGKSDE